MIAAPPEVVLDAFFDPDALATWWRAGRSVCVARPLGPYAITWEPTTWRDEILGRLGGTLHGTVMDFKAGREFFVADTYWLPPDGDPIGPMALEVTCRAVDLSPAGRQALDTGTQLRLRQSGYDEGPRWQRYYEVMLPEWRRALETLQAHLAAGGQAR